MTGTKRSSILDSSDPVVVGKKDSLAMVPAPARASVRAVIQSPNGKLRRSATGRFKSKAANDQEKTVQKESPLPDEPEPEGTTPKRPEGRFNPVMVGSCSGLVLVVLWVLLATVIGILYCTWYATLIKSEQTWYAVNGYVETATVKIFNMLQSAHNIRDAITAATTFGHIQSSTDYAAIERVLAPQMLLMPFVSSVQIIFSDSRSVLAYSQQVSEDGQQTLIMKSTGDDCYLSGAESCFDIDLVLNRFQGAYIRYPRWFWTALQMDNKFANLPGNQILHLDKPASTWLPPELFLRTTSDNSVSEPRVKTAWYPSCTFLFRAPLPATWSAQQQVIVALVTIDISSFVDSRLSDSSMGVDSRVFLVDDSGTVLSSQDKSELLLVNPSSGFLSLTKINELRNSGLAGSIGPFVPGQTIRDVQLQLGDLVLIVSALRAPLQNFAILVITGLAGTTFPDDTLRIAIWSLTGIVFVLYGVIILTGFSFSIHLARNKRTRGHTPSANSVPRVQETPPDSNPTSSLRPSIKKMMEGMRQLVSESHKGSEDDAFQS